MDFPFNVDELFPNEIVVIDNQLLPKGAEKKNKREVKELVGRVIDRIGEASARAQGLDFPITSQEVFSTTEDRIYVKKITGNDGRSKLAGFIKVGTRKLFLFDLESNYHEMRPLCVLDFYVDESTQRRGYGKQLFEFMLRKENVSPHHLAINRPSSKFIAFLGKHYNLRQTIPQVNKFVVFNNFFQDRQVPVNRRQWNCEIASANTCGNTGNDNKPVRPISMDRCIQDHLTLLPSINSRITDQKRQDFDTSKNPPSTNSMTTNNDTQPSMENRPPSKQIKYSSTGISNPTNHITSPLLKETDRYSQHSVSTGHLSRPMSQDTSWNIFGVSAGVSRCGSTRNAARERRPQ